MGSIGVYCNLKPITTQMTNVRYLLFCLVILGFTNPSWAQQATSLYSVGTPDTVYSEILGEARPIYIQLPASYRPSSTQRYPVAYLLDGELLLPALSLVQEYYSGGFTPEMVLVGIGNQENRIRDLTPTTVSTLYGMSYEGESGQADQFMAFLETELFPYVEANYAVTNYRTLIGHSYGGLFTAYALLNRPALFANYLAIDPSLDWDENTMVTDLQEMTQHDQWQGKALYLSMNGQLHMADPTVTIDNVREDQSDFTGFARAQLAWIDVLEQDDIDQLDFTWKLFPQDLHGTVPLPSLRDGLMQLFAWYQMENTHRINDFETPTADLQAIIEHRAEKLASHFGYAEPPYPEELMTVMGYMCMDMGQPDKAKMYLEQAVKFYPNSANAYDSLADYYEAQGDNSMALELVTKAFGISGDDYHKERMEGLKDK